MRILFVGNLNSYARSFQRYRALRDLGHEVTGLSYMPDDRTPGVSGEPSLWTQLCGKLGYPRDVTNINDRVLAAVASDSPDLVWVEKAPMLKPATVRTVGEEYDGVTTVYYSNDNMSKRHNRSAYITKSLQYYDAVFTVREYSKEFYREQGAGPVLYCQRAFDRTYIDPTPTDVDYRYDVTFIGTYEDERAEYIKALADHGINVHVWGNEWDHVDPTDTLHVKHEPVYGEEFIRTMHQSRILLSFFRQLNDDVTTSRAFEIPASRSFMLSERTDAQRAYFDEGVEAEYFDTVDELHEKATYYLDHPQEREAIATAGRERSIEGGYSYHDRLEEMLEQLRDNTDLPADDA